jgi:hypothetical protein
VRLTAHSGGELKVLASAAEVEVGADKEVTGSTPSPWSQLIGLMDVVLYFWLPLEITLLLIHSDLRYSQAGGSRSTFSPNADAWGDVVESGAQSN